jgi:predicted metal-dependent hydrolase
MSPYYCTLSLPLFETPDASEEEVQRLVEAWMREHARRQFVERLQNWKSWCERRKWALPKLTIRQMPKRWGSAQPSGRISLNPELVRAPSLCIDYVIAHEICHLSTPPPQQEFLQRAGMHVPTLAASQAET